MPPKPAKVGLIGCGNICYTYFESGVTFDMLDIVACADLIPDRAKEAAEKYCVERAMSVDELINDPEIEIIYNLTVPKAHAEISLKALNAGKNVHGEKPLASNFKDGRAVYELAKKKGLLVTSAPDTFMGAALQTCRKLIDDGWIGRPIATTAFMMGWGPEEWHPNPEFFYQKGSGPLLDMGPYYLTALVSLLGPVKRVTSVTSIPYPERTIGSQPRKGEKFKVEVPTYTAGVMDFVGGAVGTLIVTFDCRASELPRIEIYGTEGSLSIPDPNNFGGPVRIRRAGATDWSEVPFTHIYADNSRGIGAADMAYALRSGRKTRANVEMALHVLEIMELMNQASDQGKHLDLTTTCDRPAPLPMGLKYGQLDE